VAGLVARLGLAGLWVRLHPLAGAQAADPGLLLTRLRATAGSTAAGLIIDTDLAEPATLDMLAGGDAGGARPDAGGAQLDGGGAGAVRLALSGSPAGQARWLGLAAGPPPSVVGQIAVPAETGAGAASGGRYALFVPLRPGRDLDAALGAAAAQAADRPVLAEVAVSVGRTTAEASARADADEVFAVTGHPRRQGLFGTLEECQAAAARLAHLGATELVCYLPWTADLPDVLAQLRAIAVGAAVLRPGEPPSAAPPPPAGWGGRRST